MFKTLVTDIFFDLDHTLWDFEKNSALTFQKILTENSVGIELKDFLKAYIPINFEFWKYYREGKISKDELRFERLKVTFDTIGLSISNELIHVLSDQYIENLSTFNHLFPNTVEVLDYLKPNYKLHIITNGFQEIQDKKLQSSNIHNYFDHIINSEMAGVKKPNPKIFELALSKANTLPNKSLMIGDNLEADILGARAVGLHTLHFNANNEPEHEYCDMISDLSEIKFYL
ncbi:noncanonical pyrimidine nucleotidase, YjjG family [Arenibacter sp. TNZ]|jgi:putative hydrolase of the HAD superfamily|uniref:YjjG family noncanonical pyrimidine nucleotidase n=1 Tax=Arenibacter TaxID=178469 RepID=UPI000CD3B4A0|nr:MULTISPECIES: YjjG family noncanonical pyrimidine nucleotidase [Arenibacter]MCM4170416.1 noncanonical pyrimidine nucleotidase, YjjG family [Arenibacter sp. TNZ]